MAPLLAASEVPGVPLGTWLVALVFLAILAGIAYGLVQLVRQGQGRIGQTAGMRVVGRLPLAMNQSVVLVAIGSELLLLGVGQRVELLWRVEDPEVRQTLLAEVTQASPGVPLAAALRGMQETDFRGLLEDSLRRVREARSLHRGPGDDGG